MRQFLKIFLELNIQTQEIGAPSLLDSVLNLANPANFPDSFTENTSKTFLDSL